MSQGMFCCRPKTALLIYGACLALGTCMLDCLRYKGTQALRQRDLNSNPNPATALPFQDLFCSSFSDFPWHTDDTHKMTGSRNCSKKMQLHHLALPPSSKIQCGGFLKIFLDAKRENGSRLFVTERRDLRETSEGTMWLHFSPSIIPSAWAKPTPSFIFQFKPYIFSQLLRQSM